MPDKLTAIKIKQANGTYGPQIPVGAKIENIEYDSTYSTKDVLGTVNMNKGSIQEQINELRSQQNYITPQMYGAKGDGTTDDTESIKNAVNALNDGDTLFFPYGTYLVSFDSQASVLHKSVIKLKDKKNITIDFHGSTIKVKPNGFDRYYVIYIQECENFIIKNGTLIGDKIQHDYVTTSGTHELGYGILIDRSLSALADSEKCYGKIENMDIGYFIGDSIVTRNGYSRGKIIIDNCYLHNNRRQGISVLASDKINILNTTIEYIGTYDGIDGTSPQAGIDIEANSDTRNVNELYLNNVKIKHTTVRGLIKSAQTSVQSFIMKNSEISQIDYEDVGYVENSIIGLDNDSTLRPTCYSLLTFTNCTFQDVKGAFLKAKKLYNCIVNGKDETIEVNNHIYTVEESSNCVIENMNIKHNNSISFGVNINNIFKNCTYTHFSAIEANPFIKCTFMNIDPTGSSNLAQPFYNCVFDQQIMSNHVLYNCTVINS